MRVLLQVRHLEPIHAAAIATGEHDLTAVASLLGSEVPLATVDAAFAPVQLPARISEETNLVSFSLTEPVEFSMEPEDSSYLVRAELPDDTAAQSKSYADAFASPDVIGVWADPVIETFPVYCGDPAVGTQADVQRKLKVDALRRRGLDGAGVDVAIVDGGVNVAYLQSKGLKAKLSASRSYTPSGMATRPGRHEVEHGTMCAYDVGLIAPEARLLDHAVLGAAAPGPTVMAGYLSNAVASFSKLLQLQTAAARPRPLVVSNSWGMYRPSWDFVPGHPGNYSDNPAHPFNIVVASLERAGADILFAAGNCGRDCPDDRCAFTSRPICGANSHPDVLSVGAIDVRGRRVGYSSQGPGRLARRKPDFVTYSHFRGSAVYGATAADSGTSTSCPIAAGVIAAIRSAYPPSALSPAQLRSLIAKTAGEMGPVGWDPDYGWGALDPSAIVAVLPPSSSRGRPTARRRTAATSRKPRRKARRAKRR
jgi:subtilisin family serine protease